jgi:hypothetical protein
VAELLLFHHAQGLTAGCLSFADELRAAGADAGPDASGRQSGLAASQLCPNLRVRPSLTAGRPAPDPHDGGRRLGDLDAAHQLAETIETAELFVYPGERHLFTDNSLPDCDESAATLLKQRVLSFLDTIE